MADVLQAGAEGRQTCYTANVDYSLLNLNPEEALLPYCQEHGIAVLVRGPLRRGLLAGKYNQDTVFTDSVRADWNPGAAQRAQYQQLLARVERLKHRLQPGEEMVRAALRYVISHPVAPIAIPGAKSPEQARQNAAAGAALLTPDERQKLAELVREGSSPASPQ